MISEIIDGYRIVSEHYQMRPEEIQRESFRIIQELLPNFDHTSPEWPIVRRIVHTAGDPAIASLVVVQPGAVSAGVEALRAGRPILTDVKMLAAGINRELAGRLGCEVVCASDSPASAAVAAERGITKSAAAVLGIADRIPGSVVAIGNAPTALFALLDLVRSGLEPPSLIVGTPVGFIGAAESKEDLVALDSPEVPYVTVKGTRGGSAVAVAAVNALLVMATSDLDPHPPFGRR